MTANTPPPLMPDADIDDPMDLLNACHDKVRRFCELLDRLSQHVTQHGSDAQARDAAAAISHYFTIAAPLHHEDEDLDLYPALAQMDASLADVAQALSQEHAALNAQWAQVSAWLAGVQQGQHGAGQPVPGVAAEFAQAYRAHAQAEEQHLYPHAERLPQATRRALAQAMVRRRRQAAG